MPVGVPKVPFQVDEEEDATWIDLYELLSRERAIVLGKEIDYEISNSIVGIMIYLNMEGEGEEFHLFINSPGGSIMPGIAIFDTIGYMTSGVHTICIGQAASMASLILAGGHFNKRSAFPNARVMIHQPLCSFFDGNSLSHSWEIDELLELRNMIVNMYVETTGKPAVTIYLDLERDDLLLPREAVSYGLIDSISSDPFGFLDDQMIKRPITIPRRNRENGEPSTADEFI
uniref:ATP-dependent Clp protease proteolytic subunit n=1 Tax=Zantedeschia aethiopica TaxID=69721 RepID=A0A481YPY4_ZANAE|nr:ClpP [Zantedeschia aethiopica]